MLSAERLAELDYGAAQSEKQGRMLGGRSSVWGTLITLVGGFVLAGLQSSDLAYAVAVYPFLCCCLACLAAHNESIIDQLKAYILDCERKVGVQGYEEYNITNKRKSSGGHKAALRSAMLITEGLAIVVVSWKLFMVHLLLLGGAVFVVDLWALVMTAHFLIDGDGWVSLRGMKARIEYKGADMWVGVFWRVPFAGGLDVWVCILPCLPLHLVFPVKKGA